MSERTQEPESIHRHLDRYTTETLDWCCSRFSMYQLAESLRPKELQPNCNIVAASQDLTVVRNTVLDVTDRRSSLLRQQTETASSKGRSPLAGGDLVILYPQRSLSHGLSAIATGGFLDEDEIPPWAAWISFVEDFLIAWVPSNLISAVDQAIAVNPEASILWLRDLDHEAKEILLSRS